MLKALLSSCKRAGSMTAIPALTAKGRAKPCLLGTEPPVEAGGVPMEKITFPLHPINGSISFMVESFNQWLKN